MALTVYTIEEIGDLLQVHRTNVSRLVAEGKLRATKIGRSYRVLQSDLEKFLGEPLSGRLMSIPEAAAALKIHRLYILRLIKEGSLRSLPLGKLHRVSQSMLADFVGERPLGKILTADEVAKLLQVSRITVINLIKNKKLPALRIGKFYRLTENMLNSFLSGKTN